MTRQSTFADRLRSSRESAGLTQRALAEAAGVPQQTIASLEKGVNLEPRMGTVVRLAKALGVTLTQLAGEG